MEELRYGDEPPAPAEVPENPLQGTEHRGAIGMTIGKQTEERIVQKNDTARPDLINKVRRHLVGICLLRIFRVQAPGDDLEPGPKLVEASSRVLVPERRTEDAMAVRFQHLGAGADLPEPLLA